VHSVHADLSGLVFGLWEESDADVTYFLTNRMVGINAVGTNYNYNMNMLHPFILKKDDVVKIAVDTLK